MKHQRPTDNTVQQLFLIKKVVYGITFMYVAFYKAPVGSNWPINVL